MIRALFSAANELCFPAVCQHCGAAGSGHPLCHACGGALERSAAEPACRRCGALIVLDDAGCQRCGDKGLTHLAGVARLCVYEGPARSLLLQGKFNRAWFLVEHLAKTARRQLEISDLIAAADVAIPIPLHRRRLWSRGFNQADVIARTLVGSAKPIVYGLRRGRATALQARQPSAAARARNVAGAFVVSHSAKIAGKAVLLFDDILTTGSTLTEAARTLKKAGARSVSAVVLTVADPRANRDA